MEFYYICPENKDHKTWGIYIRRKNTGVLFHLQAITFDRDNAIKTGKGLMQQAETDGNPIEVSIQGAKADHLLPERYDP